MSSSISPNMNLIIPAVGSEAGPTYAFDVNNSLTLIDQHDHTPGKGVQITPSALNINTSLGFNNNFLTSVAGLTLIAQTVQPANATVYRSANDLYFTDGLGNNIRLTQSGAVAGTPGSIANLVAPASATYVAGSSSFVWQSNTNIAANLDAGSILLRNLSPNSTNALTLSPPTLSSNYSITLPYLPSVKSVMQIDGSGNISATSAIDGITLTDTGSVIEVSPGGITTTQLANSSVTTPILAASAVTVPKIDSSVIGLSLHSAQVSFTAAGSYSWVAPTGVTRIIVEAVGGGGGGGGAAAQFAGNAANGGTGGNTSFNGAVIGYGAVGGFGAFGGNGGGAGSAGAGSPGGPYSSNGYYTGGGGTTYASSGQGGQPAPNSGGSGSTTTGNGGGGGDSSFGQGGNGGGGNTTPGGTGNGAGGGGAGSNLAGNGWGAGGGGGCQVQTFVYTVTPGTSYPVVIGAGGAGGAHNGVGAGNGGAGSDGALFIYY